MTGSASHFGTALRQYRLAAGLTQEMLAERAELSLRTIVYLEQGKGGVPRATTLQLLVRALELTQEERALFEAAARQSDSSDVLHERDLGTQPEGMPDAGARGGHSHPPSRLPASLTSFVGRSADLRALADTLQEDHLRLLTLVGAGGMGKTRLALELARLSASRYPDSAAFVPLAPLTDAATIPSAIARAVGTTLQGSDPAAALLGFLREKSMLLVLDNLEHLSGAAEVIVAILEAAPSVHILATSRQRLQVRGERVYAVEGLEHGAARAGGEPSAAARLFMERAAREQSRFVPLPEHLPIIERIGGLVEGMPLGVEMAAAWVGVLPLESIADEIEGSLDFLQADWVDAPDRQRSMRAVFGWSWRLLEESERTALRRLAVFRGGFTREAAEVVAGARLPVLAGLLRKSLLRWDSTDAAGRYDLHELLRQFAAEQLDADVVERREVEARHGAYYLRVAEEAAAEYRGPNEVEWLNRVEREHDNIRAASDGFGARREVEMELRLAAAAVYFWFIRGYHTEGAERLLRTLARPEARKPTAVRARALNAAGYIQWVRGNLAEAHELFAEAVGITRVVDAQHDLAFGLCYLGTVLNACHEHSAAESLLEESLDIWDTLDNRTDMCLALMFLADSALGRGDWQRALLSATRSAELCRSTGNISVLPYPLRRLGYLALLDDDVERAAALYLEAMVVNREVGDRQGVAASLVGLAAVAEARGEPAEAARLLGAAGALVKSIESQLLPADAEEYERITALARSRLDAAMFAAAWATGRALNYNQAVFAATEWATSGEATSDQGLPQSAPELL